MSVLRIDKGKLASYRFDHNGNMIVTGTLFRTGVQTYKHSDGSITHELRHPDDVFDSAAMASFIQNPVTDSHPSVRVTPENIRKYMVGNLGDSIRRVDQGKVSYGEADLILRDANAINKTMPKQAGVKPKRELSGGYRADVIEESGDWFGVHYDHRQKNIRGNHVALVDEARGGHNVRLQLDSGDAVMVDDDDVVDLDSLDGDRFDDKTSDWISKKIKKLISEGKTPDAAAGEAYGMAREGRMKDGADETRYDDEPLKSYPIDPTERRVIGKTNSGKDVWEGHAGKDYSGWTVEDHSNATWSVRDEHRQLRNALGVVQRLGASADVENKLKGSLNTLKATHDFHKAQSLVLDRGNHSDHVSEVILLAPQLSVVREDIGGFSLKHFHEAGHEHGWKESHPDIHIMHHRDFPGHALERHSTGWFHHHTGPNTPANKPKHIASGDNKPSLRAHLTAFHSKK